MKTLKKVCCLALCAFSAGCSFKSAEPQSYYILPYQEDVVALQNLSNRILVYCYPSDDYSAGQCAEKFESQGFVRLKNIPKFTADNDFLKGDTYPTRRWRKDEKFPRW